MWAEGVIHFEINKWVSFGLIAAIFLLSYAYARRKGPAPESDHDDPARELLRDDK
jgi:hypothetical protein